VDIFSQFFQEFRIFCKCDHIIYKQGYFDSSSLICMIIIISLSFFLALARTSKSMFTGAPEGRCLCSYIFLRGAEFMYHRRGGVHYQMCYLCGGGHGEGWGCIAAHLFDLWLFPTFLSSLMLKDILGYFQLLTNTVLIICVQASFGKTWPHSS
jgi:hypothetical protein